MTNDPRIQAEDLNNPVCLHKGDDCRETRVGWACHRCYCIRHRHSVLVFVTDKTIGGITLSHTVPVPIHAGVSR